MKISDKCLLSKLHHFFKIYRKTLITENLGLKIKNPQNGYFVVIGLVLISVIMLLGASLTSNVVDKTVNQNNRIISERALEVAEAGLQKAIAELNNNPSYSGEQNTAFADGFISISITNIDAQTKYIESSGRINNGSSFIERKIGARAKTNTDNISFYYGLQVGQGGLNMSNNSIVYGNAYSNGSVVGATNSRVTGDLWVAGAGALYLQAENSIQTNGFYLGRTSFGKKIAQEFFATSSQAISKASFYIKKTGAPPNATVTLRNYGTGVPTGEILTQGTLQSNLVGTNYSWVDVTFNNNPPLIEGNNYWITIEMPSTSGSNYYTIGISDNIYGGIAMFFYRSDWEEMEGDFDFKIFSGTSGQTKIEKIIVGGDAHASLIKDSTITGGAYYQTIQNSTAGSYHPDSPDPPLQNFPISDGQIADWIADAEAGGTIQGDYFPSTSISLGPKKINGNFTMTNGTTLIVTGTIYVTGDINFSNNVVVRLNSSYGNNSGIIIADGKINLSNGVTVQKINATGYVMFISKFSQTNYDAISLENNVRGGIYYAPYGSVEVENNANITEVSADKIKLANNTWIVYESGLANINFSSGSGASWTLEKGSWSILQ